MVVETSEEAALRLNQPLLCLGELGQQPGEDVCHRDPAREREPAAPRDTNEKAERAREDVDERKQDRGQDQLPPLGRVDIVFMSASDGRVRAERLS